MPKLFWGLLLGDDNPAGPCMRGDPAGRSLHETRHCDTGPGVINGPMIVLTTWPKRGGTLEDLKGGVSLMAHDLRVTGSRLGLRIDSEQDSGGNL